MPAFYALNHVHKRVNYIKFICIQYKLQSIGMSLVNWMLLKDSTITNTLLVDSGTSPPQVRCRQDTSLFADVLECRFECIHVKFSIVLEQTLLYDPGNLTQQHPAVRCQQDADLSAGILECSLEVPNTVCVGLTTLP